MPFGPIFAALYFFVCAWLGAQLPAVAGGPGRLAGLLVTTLAGALAFALLARRPWARWAGAVAASGLALLGLRLAAERGGGLDFLVVLGGLATAALLIVPATGRLTQEPGATPSGGALGRVLATVAGVSALGLLVLITWGSVGTRLSPPPSTVAAPTSDALPASAPERIEWTDFGSGLARARSLGRPMLVNFVTDWCGYCIKMDRTTFKHPSVVARLSEIVAARVDTEDPREVHGYRGADLAARFQVGGTPTFALVDGGGRVLARTGGYQTPEQFLRWLDGARGSAPTNVGGS